MRSLIDALEALFGFGDGLDGSDPEFLRAGSMKRDADALPAVLHAKLRRGKGATEAEIFRAGRRFEKTVGLGGSEQIDDRFDSDGDGFFERLLELEIDFAGDLATVRGGAEGKAFGEQEARRVRGL